MNRRTNKRNRRSNRHIRRQRGGDLKEQILQFIERHISKRGSYSMMYLVQKAVESSPSEVDYETEILNMMKKLTDIKKAQIFYISPKEDRMPTEFLSVAEELKIKTWKRKSQELPFDNIQFHISLSKQIPDHDPILIIIPTTMSEIQSIASFIHTTKKEGVKQLITPCYNIYKNYSNSEIKSITNSLAGNNETLSASAASSNRLDPARGCNVCGKTPESIGRTHHKRCDACNRNKAPRYCSTECQRINWERGHKSVHQKSNK